jgi:hypothetical protein
MYYVCRKEFLPVCSVVTLKLCQRLLSADDEEIVSFGKAIGG